MTMNDKPLATKVKKHVKQGGLSYYWLERPKFDGSQNCANLDTEFFYPVSELDEQQVTIRMLKKVCSDCPFKQPCQEYALAHERYGFWAGMTTHERDRVRKVKGWGLVPVEYIGDFFTNNNLRVGTQTR
jgi:hypothetical protein